MLYKNWGQREFSKFSQRHGKLTLPQKKGNYPVITIYDDGHPNNSNAPYDASPFITSPTPDPAGLTSHRDR